MTDNYNFGRREILQAGSSLTLIGALGACGYGANSESENLQDTGPASKGIGQSGFYQIGEYLGPQQMLFLSSLAQMIIPKTDTGGAIEAQVPSRLQAWLSNSDNYHLRDLWRDGLARLQASLNAITSKTFMDLNPDQQMRVLEKFDADIYNGIVPNDFYKRVKAMIVRAYYTSELGASQELIYEAVPGPYRGCVPFSEIGRAWAT